MATSRVGTMPMAPASCAVSRGRRPRCSPTKANTFLWARMKTRSDGARRAEASARTAARAAERTAQLGSSRAATQQKRVTASLLRLSSAMPTDAKVRSPVSRASDWWALPCHACVSPSPPWVSCDGREGAVGWNRDRYVPSSCSSRASASFTIG